MQFVGSVAIVAISAAVMVAALGFPLYVETC